MPRNAYLAPELLESALTSTGRARVSGCRSPSGAVWLRRDLVRLALRLNSAGRPDSAAWNPRGVPTDQIFDVWADSRGAGVVRIRVRSAVVGALACHC